MRLLLPLSIGSLIGLLLGSNADAQTSDKVLRSAYCYGAFSELENFMLKNPPTGGTSSSKFGYQQALAEIDHDKKEFLDYIIAKAALGSPAAALAIKQGDNDEDAVGTIIDTSERDAIDNKIKGCYAVLAQLPL